MRKVWPKFAFMIKPLKCKWVFQVLPPCATAAGSAISALECSPKSIALPWSKKTPLKIIQMNISKPNHCNDIWYCFMPIMSDKFCLITLFLMGENTFYLRIVYYGQHLILIGLKHILPITAFDRRKYSSCAKIALIDCDYSLVRP